MKTESKVEQIKLLVSAVSCQMDQAQERMQERFNPKLMSAESTMQLSNELALAVNDPTDKR